MKRIVEFVGDFAAVFPNVTAVIELVAVGVFILLGAWVLCD